MRLGNRLFASALLLTWASFASVGCGAEPPLFEINVIQGPNSPPIPGLARLNLIVRECENERLALRQSVPVRGEAPKLNAPVEPGALFYVWLQGWIACPEGVACVPESSASAGDCTCVGEDQGPSAQLLATEGCTDWIVASENGKVETLTLSAIEWSRPETRLCPPPDLPEGQCVQPE